MENFGSIRRSMDELVFEGRNKTYGAFQLRRLYDKHMMRGMIISILFFLLAISSPHIYRMIKGFLPDTANELVLGPELILSEPPPIDRIIPPQAPPPNVEPPPLRSQIRFVPPTVVREDDAREEAPPLPTTEDIRNNEIGTITRSGELDGVDPSLIEDAPPGPAIIEDVEVEKPFEFVEQMPTFPDGEKAMYEFIKDNLVYPQIARENKISGKVFVRFVVSKEGYIQDARVLKGPGGGINEEALRVVNSMPRWKPGKHNGRPVPVTFTLPINLVLQ